MWPRASIPRVGLVCSVSCSCLWLVKVFLRVIHAGFTASKANISNFSLIQNCLNVDSMLLNSYLLVYLLLSPLNFLWIRLHMEVAS